MGLKKCFGIISYFCWEQPERKQRQDRLDKLVRQLSALWPDVDILVIAQQWKYYEIESKVKNKVIRYNYGPLGILGARQELRKKFLELGYDYIIMFDDDAIIQYDKIVAPREYMTEIDKHPGGFCFIYGGNQQYCPYADSQLNLCAISRDIYEKDPIPNIDAQKSEGFEDRIWSTLLHYKYADKEFLAPKTIRCCHFKNPNIKDFGGEVPSTWASHEKHNWAYMRARTLKIEEYIAAKHKLPERLQNFYTVLYFDNEQRIKDFNNKYHFMQLWGDCSGLGYLGALRLVGPVDNVYSKSVKNIEYLLDNKYFDMIKNTTPISYQRRKSFVNDSNIGYSYETVNIIHNNPKDPKYLTELEIRNTRLQEFYKKLRENNNYYFTINFNDAICNPQINELRNNDFIDIITILKKYDILDHCIFIGLAQYKRKDTSNMHIKNISYYIKKYNLKYVEILDNDVWDTTATHLQFIDKVEKLLG